MASRAANCYTAFVFGLFNKSSGEPVGPGPFGRFTLQERVASGGMADIWLATDSRNRPHALRLMLSELARDRAARKRFERGCEVLERVQSHPSVIGYFEHGSVNGHPYCLMEYVEGANLKEVQAGQDSLLADNVARFLIDSAEALEHVHESGFIHLDFKPENLIVSRNGSLRLVDFDLARPIVDAPLKLAKNPGTPAYMAPEQLLGKPIDHRVDIFAHGVMAYELVTAQKPFGAEDIQEILALQTDRSQFAPPRRWNPGVPAALETIILKCLETNPARRYPFMSLLVRDLKNALYL